MKIAYKDWNYFPVSLWTLLGILLKPVVGPDDPPPLGYGSINYPYKYFPFLFYIKMVHIHVKMVGRWSLWKLEANALLKGTYMSELTGTDHDGHRVPPNLPASGIFKSRQQMNTLFFY